MPLSHEQYAQAARLAREAQDSMDPAEIEVALQLIEELHEVSGFPPELDALINCMERKLTLS